jgi:hypothetical protein
MGNAGCDVYNPVADGNQNVACFMMISNCLPWPFMKKKQFENVVVVFHHSAAQYWSSSILL